MSCLWMTTEVSMAPSMRVGVSAGFGEVIVEKHRHWWVDIWDYCQNFACFSGEGCQKMWWTGQRCRKYFLVWLETVSAFNWQYICFGIAIFACLKERLKNPVRFTSARGTSYRWGYYRQRINKTTERWWFNRLFNNIEYDISQKFIATHLFLHTCGSSTEQNTHPRCN